MDPLRGRMHLRRAVAVVNAEWLTHRTELDQSRLASGELRPAQRFAECLQVEQRAGVGGEQAGLGVGDAVLHAVAGTGRRDLLVAAVVPKQRDLG